MLSKKLTRAKFAFAVRAHRERLGLSQADVAPLLDVSPRTVWQWENQGRDTPFPMQRGVLEILLTTKPKGTKA